MSQHSWTYGDTRITASGDYRGHDELSVSGEQLYEAALRRRAPGHSTGTSGRGDRMTDPGRVANLSLDVDVRSHDGELVENVQEQVYGTPTPHTMAAYVEDLEPDHLADVGQALDTVLEPREPIDTRMAVVHFIEDVRQGNIPELRR